MKNVNFENNAYSHIDSIISLYRIPENKEEAREAAKELAKRAKTNDKDLQEFIISNAAYIKKIVLKTINHPGARYRTVDPCELFNDAVIYCIEEFKKFDPEKGVGFITYMNYRLPHMVPEFATKHVQLQEDTESLDVPAFDDEECSASRIDTIGTMETNPEEIFFKKEQERITRKLIKQLFESLSADEKELVCKYNGCNGYQKMSFEQIAKEMGMTKQGVAYKYNKIRSSFVNAERKALAGEYYCYE